LQVSNNQISSFDASSLINLEYLKIDNNGLTFLNVNNLLQLSELIGFQNQLTNIDISTLLNLELLSCGIKQINELNLSNSPNLERLFAADNELVTLDLSDTSVYKFILRNNNLTELFIKKGVESNGVNFNEKPDLRYICRDESESSFIFNVINGYNYNTVVNSYCSLTRGGVASTIEGNGR
jgi:hypothetical protein